MPARSLALALLVLVLTLPVHGRESDDTGVPVLRLASLGVPIPEKRAAGRAINELRFHDGKLFVGTGDATVNTGPTDVVAWDPDSGEFVREFRIEDEGIYAFRLLDGRLAIPGVDATESWDLGNVYVREESGWVKHRSVPKGIHVFDLAEWRGRWYAATGTYVDPAEEERLAVGGVVSSADRGATWQTEKLTPGDRKAVWRYRSLVVFQDRLYAFPYAYGDIPASAIPENRRTDAGPSGKNEGVDVHTLYLPDPLGATDAEVHDGVSWRAVDLVPDEDVCYIAPHVFGDSLLLSVVTGRWLAPFTEYVFENRRLPDGASAFLLAFDGKTTSRVPLEYDSLRDLRVGDGRVAVLYLKDGRYLLSESDDLKTWTTVAPAVGDAHPLSIERAGDEWFIGMRDGNLMRSVGTAPAGTPAQPDRFEITALAAPEAKGPWAAIDRFADADRPARLVCARSEPGLVEVTLENVGAFRLFLRDAGIGDALTLKVDGEVVHRGAVEGKGEILAVRGEDGFTTKLGDGTSATWKPPLKVAGNAAIEIRRTEATAAQWVADAIREAAGADLALVNFGTVRRDLPKGPIHVTDIRDFVYPNKIATFRVKGADLIAMLRHNYSTKGWNRCAPSGFTGTIDAEGALVSCTLDPARMYLVGLPDWTARNGEELFGRVVEHEVLDVGTQDALVAWLEKHGTVSAIEPRLGAR